MQYSAGIRLRLSSWLLAAGLDVLPGSAGAQEVATGIIEARVFNSRTGEYLENARITLDGTQLEAFKKSQ